jgi:hypothetical protein
MSEHQVLLWFYGTWLGHVTREVSWLFAFFESVHFIGLCILMGALLLVDLRLIGFFKNVPIRSVLQFTHLAVLGFLINATSGLGFFCSDPFNYWHNPAFKLKMALVLIAGLNVAWFELAERHKVLALAPQADTDGLTKLVAVLSLCLWTAILLLGRLLPSFGING